MGLQALFAKALHESHPGLPIDRVASLFDADRSTASGLSSLLELGLVESNVCQFAALRTPSRQKGCALRAFGMQEREGSLL